MPATMTYRQEQHELADMVAALKVADCENHKKITTVGAPNLVSVSGANTFLSSGDSPHTGDSPHKRNTWCILFFSILRTEWIVGWYVERGRLRNVLLREAGSEIFH